MDEEALNSYKTTLCKFYMASGRCDKHIQCLNAHGPDELRRDPSVYHYQPRWCHNVSRSVGENGRQKLMNRCPEKEACDFAHTLTEIQFHPTVFHTKLCDRGGKKCTRGDICAFAHSVEDPWYKQHVVSQAPLQMQHPPGLTPSEFRGPTETQTTSAKSLSNNSPSTSNEAAGHGSGVRNAFDAPLDALSRVVSLAEEDSVNSFKTTLNMIEEVIHMELKSLGQEIGQLEKVNEDVVCTLNRLDTMERESAALSMKQAFVKTATPLLLKELAVLRNRSSVGGSQDEMWQKVRSLQTEIENFRQREARYVDALSGDGDIKHIIAELEKGKAEKEEEVMALATRFRAFLEAGRKKEEDFRKALTASQDQEKRLSAEIEYLRERNIEVMSLQDLELVEEALMNELSIISKAKVTSVVRDRDKDVSRYINLVEEQNLHLQSLMDARRCKGCHERDAQVLLMPCHHACLCVECADMMVTCPLCMQFIGERIQTYNS